MTKIHGVVYILVGLIITGFSWYMLPKAPGFRLFIYAGLLFLLVGILKTPFNLKERRERLGIEKPKAMPRARSNFCSRCGSRASAFSQFCQNCGGRL